TAFEVRKAELDAGKSVLNLAGSQPRIYDVTMHATGVAQTDVQVAQFVSKLNRSPLLQDVNLLVTEEFTAPKDNEKLRKFQIEMTLNPDAKVDADSAQKHLKTAGMS